MSYPLHQPALFADPTTTQPKPAPAGDEHLHPAGCDRRKCARCAHIRSDPLVTTLQVAVPLWIARADDWGDGHRPDLLARWRQEAAPDILERADIVLYTGGKRGDTAKTFNTLARGLAALAHHTGGAYVFALLWCAKHSPGGTITDGDVCPRCLQEHGDQPIACGCCTTTVPLPPQHPAYVGPRAVAHPDKAAA